MAKTISFNPSNLAPEPVAPSLKANVMDRFIEGQLFAAATKQATKSVNTTAHYIQRKLDEFRKPNGN